MQPQYSISRLSSLQSTCIGCKRSFQQGQTLPPEGIYIEYKNYYLPVRQHQQRWILLKTIIAFLNSKGGTIYMGVDDGTREVLGVMAQLKQQDLFMLQLDNLMQEIKPAIDLRHKEEVRVQFVPVLKDKTFQGKYIIKIIVKQGDPSKVYHFAQTLKFFNEDKRHHDQEFKVLWGFYRSNMGKVDSIKGTELLRQVYQKAKRPSCQFKTFHEGCNPQPLRVSVRNLNIGFKNLTQPGLRTNLLQFIRLKLRSLHLQSSYSIQQLQSKQTVILKFNSITQYKQADVYLLEHIDQMCKLVHQTNKQQDFIDQGVIDNTHFYRVGVEVDMKARYRKNRGEESLKSVSHNNQAKPNNHKNQSKQKVYVGKNDQVLTPIKKKQNQQKHNPLFSSFQNQNKKTFNDNDNKNHKSNFSPNNPSSKVKKQSKQSTQSKQSNQSPSKQQNQIFYIKFFQITQRSFSKMLFYLQTNLGLKLNSIPHQVIGYPDQLQRNILITFNSVQDLDNFMQELISMPHHHKVLNGFGEKKEIKMTVRKGNQIKGVKFEENFEKKYKDNIENNQKKGENNIAPDKNQGKNEPHNFQSTTKALQQKLKQQSLQSELKDLQLFISNLRLQLKEQQMKSLFQVLDTIFQYYFPSKKIEIINRNYINGVIELRFEKKDERNMFIKIIQTQLVKMAQFKIFFSAQKILWGLASGNIIVHHYKPVQRIPFKQEIQKLFIDQDFTFITSKYVKDKQKFYLNLSFNASNVSKALDVLIKNVCKSPLIQFASGKQGIIVIPQINRI